MTEEQKRELTGSEIFTEYQRLDPANQTHAVYVWYQERRWLVTGMSAEGGMNLASDGPRMKFISIYAEKPLPVEFVRADESGGNHRGVRPINERDLPGDTRP